MSHVEGLNTVLGNMNNVMLDSIAKFNGRMAEAGERLLDEAQMRASLTDHTQEDLDNLGHPYSSNHGQTDGKPHGDDGLIHHQTGTLFNDIRMEMSLDKGGLETNVAVGVPSSNDRIANLIEGAPAQRPRPFLQRALRGSKDDIQAILNGKEASLWRHY